MENISQHISYDEAVISQTALRLHIDNTPSPDIIATMKLTAEKIFEPARTHFGPLIVDSFYRCPTLNNAIGGAKTSQHMRGEAIDIKMPNGDNLALLEWARHNLDFDQIIYEFDNGHGQPTWVHISYHAGYNRKSVIRAVKRNGVTVYENY